MNAFSSEETESTFQYFKKQTSSDLGSVSNGLFCVPKNPRIPKGETVFKLSKCVVQRKTVISNFHAVSFSSFICVNM